MTRSVQSKLSRSKWKHIFPAGFLTVISHQICSLPLLYSKISHLLTVHCFQQRPFQHITDLTAMQFNLTSVLWNENVTTPSHAQTPQSCQCHRTEAVPFSTPASKWGGSDISDVLLTFTNSIHWSVLPSGCWCRGTTLSMWHFRLTLNTSFLS